jgi:hypothetical protein
VAACRGRDVALSSPHLPYPSPLRPVLSARAFLRDDASGQASPDRPGGGTNGAQPLAEPAAPAAAAAVQSNPSPTAAAALALPARVGARPLNDYGFSTPAAAAVIQAAAATFAAFAVEKKAPRASAKAAGSAAAKATVGGAAASATATATAATAAASAASAAVGGGLSGGLADSTLAHLVLTVSSLALAKATGDVGASRALHALGAALASDDALWLLHTW